MKVTWTDPYGLLTQGSDVIITDVPKEVRDLLLNTKAPYRISITTSGMAPGEYLRKCEETGQMPPPGITKTDETEKFYD